MTFKNKDKFKINSSCISTSIDEKSVILNIENGKYYDLNQTASNIWNCLKKNYIFKNIVSKLIDSYEIDENLARKSLQEFLESCIYYDFIKKI